MTSAPEIRREHRQLAGRMRLFALRGWYIGDPESLVEYGARAAVQGVTEPELTVSLLLSRDRMHHSVGWWRNAEYEYCWHLSIAAKACSPDDEAWEAASYEKVPHDEVRYWAFAHFGDELRMSWTEPGGTDPRLTPEHARRHATMWHIRLFLHPEILDPKGQPFHPFMPKGEVYTLTRWIDGLTPEKVDR